MLCLSLKKGKPPFLLIFILLCGVSFGGQIYPDGTTPIRALRNNMGATSDYVFSFMLSTTITQNPKLVVTFPSQWSPLFLDVSQCKITLAKALTVLYSGSCILSLSSNQVSTPTGNIQNFDAGTYTATITSVLNPMLSAQTGTGQFKLESYSNSVVQVDSNGNFGTIGLAPPYGIFASANVINDGSNMAGYLTNYLISFQNNVGYDAYTWFRLTFPSGFTFSAGLSCYVVNLNIPLTCVPNGLIMTITGLTTALPAGSYSIKLRGVYNPFRKGLTGTFIFESLQNNVTTVVEMNNEVPGVIIAAGQINYPGCTGSPLNMNLMIQYTCIFTPMNPVAQGGAMEYDFPPEFGPSLDKCSIVSGLTALSTSNPIKCDTIVSGSTKKVWITNFADFVPTQVTFTVWALNPATPGVTSNFQVHTYGNMNDATSIIDETLTAGQITISTIDAPYFIAVDVYTYLFNQTLSGVCPLDFRLFTDFSRNLPTQTVTAPIQWGQIWLQIPIWWNQATFNPPNISIGTKPLWNTSFANQLFQMYTSDVQGLGTCELPISIGNVQVTPIPGSWDFRVLTFVNSTTTPVEQDLFTMIIVPTALSNVNIYVTNTDQSDPDTVLRLSFNVVLPVPTEGAINLNFTVNDDIYQNLAGWQDDLGLTPAVAYTKIPCRVSLNAGPKVVLGYPASTHPNVRCYAFKGDQTLNKTAVISVFGFANTLGGGQYVEIDVPNIKICNSLNRACQVTLSTAYTLSLANPYTLNVNTVTVMTVVAPPISTASNVATQPTFTPTEICLVSTYTFTLSLPLALSAGDHILLKFNSAQLRFTLQYNGITSSAGVVDVIYNFITDQLYFLIRLTGALAAGTPTFTIGNLRNPNDATGGGIVSSAIVYRSLRKYQLVSWTTTMAAPTPGGITGANVNLLPATRIVSLNEWFPMVLSFTICHALNVTNAIRITIPSTNFQAVRNTCAYLSGFTGVQQGIDTQFQCSLGGGGTYYLIQGMALIPQYTTMSFELRFQAQSSATIPGNFAIQVYSDVAMTTPGDYNSAAFGYGTAIGGPPSFQYISIGNLTRWRRKANVGNMGDIIAVVKINTKPVNGGSGGYFRVVVPTASITINAQTHCRINGVLAYVCSVSYNGTSIPPATYIDLVMQSSQSLAASTIVTLEVSTRSFGTYNGVHGVTYSLAGTWPLSVYSMDSTSSWAGGTYLEFSSGFFSVNGPQFINFYVYSICKEAAARSYYQIYFTIPTYPTILNYQIPSNLDPVTPTNLFIEFETANNGFAADLGTGIAHKGSIPCVTPGLIDFNATAKIWCQLWIATPPGNVIVKVLNFALIDANTVTQFRIDIPNIYNPSTTFVSPKVMLHLDQVTAATGAITQLFYGEYDLTNVTGTYTYTFQSVTGLTPVLSTNQINQPSVTLTLPLKPQVTVGMPDAIIVQIPTYWILVPGQVLCSMTVDCVAHPNSGLIIMQLRAGGAVTGIASGATVNVVITLNSPPCVIPATDVIKTYFYVRNKWQSQTTYNAMTPPIIPTPITGVVITPQSNVVNDASLYNIQFVAPDPLPVGAAIVINYDTAYSVPLGTTSCDNDAASGSLITGTGFNCVIDDTAKTITITGFDAFPGGQINLRTFFTNPPTAGTFPFSFSTYLINQVPLNKLVDQVLNVAGPAIVAVVVVPPVLWETQFWDVTKSQYTAAGTYGVLTFRINLRTTIQSSGYLQITMPGAFTIAPGGEPYCLWDSVFAPCFWTASTGILKVAIPIGSATLPASQLRLLNISSLNAVNQINGWRVPATQNLYSFKLDNYPTGAALTESQNVQVQTYGTAFTVFSSWALWSNQNLWNIFTFTFEAPASIPTGYYFEASFPTINREYLTPLFANDLGSGIASGASFPYCQGVQNVPTSLTCTLFWGNQDTGSSARVRITGFTTIAAGARVILRIDRIKNPSVTDDQRHVDIMFSSYTGGGVLVNTGVNYDFSILKYDPTAAPLTPIPSPSNSITGSTGVTWTFDFSTMASGWTLVNSNLYDFIVVQYPTTVPFSSTMTCSYCVSLGSCAATSCFLSSGGQYVVYDNVNSPAVATTFYLQQLASNQAISFPSSGIVFQAYVVKNRVAYTLYTFGAYLGISANTLISGSVTGSSLGVNAMDMFTVKFELGSGTGWSPIPATGAIEIVTPTTAPLIQNPDSFCSVGSNIPGTPTCTYSAGKYTMIGFNQVAVAQNCTIIFWAQNPTSAGALTPWVVNVYADQAKANLMYTRTITSQPTITSVATPFALYPMDIDPITPYQVINGNIAPFRFNYMPGPYAVTTASRIRITFPTGVSIPSGATLLCTFGNYLASLCYPTQSAPLIILIAPPWQITLGQTTKYPVVITTERATSNIPGLQFSLSGLNTATVAAAADGSTYNLSLPLAFEVSPADFTSLRLISFWSNAAATNNLIVLMTPSVAIPLGGAIVVGFPVLNEDGSVQYFAQDLGYGVGHGATVTYGCDSLDRTTLIPIGPLLTCTLYYSNWGRTYMVITGFKAVAAGTAIQFSVEGFTNPTGTSGNIHVNIELQIRDASNAITNQRMVYNVFSVINQAFSTTTTPTFLSSSTSLQNPAQYTFNNLNLNSKNWTPIGRLILEFPRQYTLTAGAPSEVTPVTGGTLTRYGRFLFHVPGNNQSSITTYKISGVMNPYGAVSANQIKVHFVYDTCKFSENQCSYAPAFSFLPDSITASGPSSTTTDAGHQQTLSFSITPTTDIKFASIIEIQVPAVFQSILKVWTTTSGVNTGSTSSINNVASPKTARIQLAATYTSASGAITVNMIVINPSTAVATGSFTVNIYADPTATSLQSTSAVAGYTVTNAKPAATPTCYLYPSSMRISTDTTMTIYYTPSATYDTGSSLVVEAVGYATPGSLTFACTQGGVAYTCTGPSSSKVTLNDAADIVLNSGLNKITITYANPTSAGSYPITLYGSLQAGTLAEVCAPTVVELGSQSFTSISFSLSHYQVGELNTLVVSFRPSISLTEANGDTILLEFDQLFATDLGTGLSNGSSIPCESQSLNSASKIITCMLVTGDRKVYIQNWGTIASGTTYDFELFRFKNPSSTAFPGRIIMKTQKLTAGTNLVTEDIGFVDTQFSNVAFSTSATATASASTTATQATSTLTISITAGLAVSAGKVMILMPGASYGLRGATETATCSDGSTTLTCKHYRNGGVILVTLASSYNPDIDIIVSNYENPVDASGTSLIVYFANSTSPSTNALVYKLTIPITFTTAASTGASVIPLTSSSASPAIYQFRVTLVNKIPIGGVITFDWAAVTASPTITSFSVVSFTGTWTGYPAATVSGSRIVVSGFNYLTPGTITFIANVTGSPGTVSIPVASWSSTSFTNQIEGGTATLTSSTSPFFVGIHRGIFTDYFRANANQVGIFRFRFKPTTTVVSGTHQVKVTFPAGFVISNAGNQKIFCRATYLVDRFKTDSVFPVCWVENSVNYVMMQNLGLTSGQMYEISIYNPELANLPSGILMPSAGDYTITVNIETNSSGSILEQGSFTYRVFASTFTAATIRSFFAGSSGTNVIQLSFKNSQTIPASSSNGVIQLELPYYYTDESGTGTTYFTFPTLTNGVTVPCIATSGVTVPSGTLTCQFLQGGWSDLRPAKILISNFNQISSGATVKIDIQGLPNPGTLSQLSFGRLLTYINNAGTITELEGFKNPSLVYIATQTIVNQTANFPAITPTTVVQSSGVGMTLTLATAQTAQPGDYLQYIFNTGFLTTTYTTTVTSTVGAAAAVDIQDLQTIYITPTIAVGGTSITNIVMANMFNPMSTGTASSPGSIVPTASVTLLRYGVPLYTCVFNQTNIALTMGTITAASVTPNPANAGQSVVHTFQFTVNQMIPAGGSVYLTFPAGYTGLGTTCTPSTGFPGSPTCTAFNSTTYQITLTSSIASGTALTALGKAVTPATGPTATFTIETHSVGTPTNLIARNTAVAGISLTSVPGHLWLSASDVTSNPIVAQQADTAPIRFTTSYTSALTVGNRIEIVLPSNLYFPAPSDDLKCFIITAPPMTVYSTLNCFWSTNIYQIYTPPSMTLASGTQYTVFIGSNRQYISGAMNPNGFLHPANQTISITARAIQGASTLTGATQQLIVPLPKFRSIYLYSYTNTYNTMTIFEFSFSPLSNFQANTSAAWSQIVIEFETVSTNGTTVFPTDLSRGLVNGATVDCPSLSHPALKFQCTLVRGAGSNLAPATILMQSSTALAANSGPYTFFLPMIGCPVSSFVLSNTRMYHRYYTAGVWTNTEEFRKWPVFWTSNFSTNVAAAATQPTYTTGNLVGLAEQIQFKYPVTYGPTVANVKDRIVIMPVTSSMTVPSYAYSLASMTSNLGNVYSFPLSDCFEVIVNSAIANTGTYTLTITNYVNQPFVIAGGVQYRVFQYINGEVTDILTFPLTAQASPNVFPIKSITPSPNPPYQGQPADYDIIFQPYNSVPSTGYILLTFPATYTSIQPGCIILSGLVDSTCQAVGLTVNISGFQSYNSQYPPPLTGNQIKLHLTATSPAAAGVTPQFKLQTFWTTTGNELIDQDNSFGTVNIIAGSLFVWIYVNQQYLQDNWMCSRQGTTGNVEINFTSAYSMTYTAADYITIDHGGLLQTFSPGPTWPAALGAGDAPEIICYFIDPGSSPLKNKVKTHRCDPNGAGTQLNIYVTEELPIAAGTMYTIWLQYRGNPNTWNYVPLTYWDQNRWDGFYWGQTPSKFWFRLTNSQGEANNVEVPIPPCNCTLYTLTPDVTVWDQNFWTGMNITWTTGASSPNPFNRGRMLLEFSTNNEVVNFWAPDLSQTLPSLNQSTGIFCNGRYYFPSNQQWCTGRAVRTYAAAGPFSPATIIIDNYPVITAGTSYNMYVAQWRNPATTGWPYFGHVRFRIQTMQNDGTWLDQTLHTFWYIVNTVLSASTASATAGVVPGLWTNRPYWGLQNMTFWAQRPLIASLGFSDVMMYNFSFPYNTVLPQRLTCAQVFHTPTAFYYNYTTGANNYHNYEEVGCVALQTLGLMVYQPFWPWAVNTLMSLYMWAGWGITTPQFVMAAGTPIQTYWVVGHHVTEIQTATLFSSNGGVNPVLQTPSNTNPVNQLLTYKLGLYTWTAAPMHAYTRIFFPTQFQTPAANCYVNKGYMIPFVDNLANNISCTVTAFNATYYLLQISNFVPIIGNNLYIIELTMNNPSTAGYTSNIWVRTYTQVAQTGTDYSTDLCNMCGGWTWIGQRPFPQLFRVHRNTVSFENRRQSVSQWGEINVRVIPKITFPPTNTSVQIWIPSEFDLPNGGQRSCYIGNIYHTDLPGQNCDILSNKTAILNTNQLSGLPAYQCSLINYTTIGAIGGDGFLSPSSPGSNQFQVFLYINSALMEYQMPGASTVPIAIPGGQFKFVSTWNEAGQSPIIRITVNMTATIPQGYQVNNGQTDVTKKAPVGSLSVYFATQFYNGATGYQASWALDLGLSPTLVSPCKVISGLTAKANGSIVCKVIPSTQVSSYYPVEVQIQNFETILKGTTGVQIHLQSIVNPGNWWLNPALVQLFAYETDATGSVTQLIAPSNWNLNVQQCCVYVNPILWTPTPDVQLTTGHPSNVVGGTLNIMIGLGGDTFQANDAYVLKIPNSTFLSEPDDGSISAALQQTLPGPPVVVNVFVINFIQYVESRQIYLEPPTGWVTQNFITGIILSRWRNAGYESPGVAYSFRLIHLRGATRIWDMNVVGMNGPVAAQFVSQFYVASSYYKKDVNVQYQFQIVGSYAYPSGSNVTIQLVAPTFDHIPLSSPSANCSFDSSSAVYLMNCQILASTITFQTSQNVPEKTPLNIFLTGVKNPWFSNPAIPSTIAANTISATVLHPNGNRINFGYFGPVTFIPQRTQGSIYLVIAATTVFQGITADYQFSIQNTYALPSQGQISIIFPAAFGNVLPTNLKLDSLTCSFQSTPLIYNQTYYPNNFTLIIATSFVWPAKSSIYIQLKGISNPTTTASGIFNAQTVYDGQIIDASDPTDQSTNLYYTTFVSSMSVVSTSFNPQNEGELSTYTFTLSTTADVKSGTELNIQFPSAYSSTLTTYDKSLLCSSPILGITFSCSASGGKLALPISSLIPAGTSFDIKVVGIVNPNFGSSSKSFSIATTMNGNIVQYSQANTSFSSTNAPGVMNLTYLNATSTSLQEKADYTFCSALPGQVPIQASIFIDFPPQFTFKLSSYACTVGASMTALSYNGNPTCVIQQQLRRFVITGHTMAFNGGTANRICYTLFQIENPADSGSSGSFSMAVYNQITLQVMYRSYGALNYPSNINYQRVGYNIIVAYIPDVVVNTMSNDIAIALEHQVPYNVYVTPTCPGFQFIPTTINFLSYLSPIQSFKIKPLPTAVLGVNRITWVKKEDEGPRFAQIPDTFFNLISQANFQQLKMIVSPTVSRAALYATSLPMTITLTNPPATPLVVRLSTLKPYQGAALTFYPSNTITFKAGDTVKNFTYVTNTGAVSGLISVTIDDYYYKNIYYVPNNNITFEILDIDKEPPALLNYYVVDLDRTYMYFRVSTSESTRVSYILTLKGTITPPADEVRNSTLRTLRGTKTDAPEIVGYNTSNQTTVTQTFIYYDTYLYFTGLEEQTDYVLFFVCEDLSGNYNKTIVFNFTTLNKYYPATFEIDLSDGVNTSSLIGAFGLVTGLVSSRFIVNSAPPKFTISEATEKDVKYILGNQTVTYSFTILPNKTANEKRPLEFVSTISKSIATLNREISQIVTTQNIMSSAYEITQFPQEFTYLPYAIQLTEFTITYNISLKRNGTMFVVVMLHGSQIPTPRQMQYGLNSTNFNLSSDMYAAIPFVVPATTDDSAVVTQVVTFNNLMDYTVYDIYFVGANNLPVNPDLMKQEQIFSDYFMTQREVFVVAPTYQSGQNLQTYLALVVSLLAIIILA